WSLPRGALTAEGVSYKVCSRTPGSYTFFGVHVGETAGITQGEDHLTFSHGSTGDWENAADIGPVDNAGSTRLVRGTYIQEGQGQDIWTTGDEFHFAYRTVTGNFDISTHFLGRVDPGHGSRWGRYGLMARYNCDTDSAFHFHHGSLASAWGPEPYDSFRNTRRLPDGNASSVGNEHFLRPDLFPNTPQHPPWMRMQRIGPAIYQYVAEDRGGRPGPWVMLGSSADPNMPTSLLAGVAVGSHSGSPGRVNYDNLRIRDQLARPELPLCSKGDVLYRKDFDNESSLEDAEIAIRDQEHPFLVEGRLRLIEDGVTGLGSAIWFDTRGLDLDEGFCAEFDLFLGRDDERRADGVTFAAFQVPRDRPGASYPSSLDPKTLVGLTGGSLGYGGHTIAERVQLGHPSFAIELDTWKGLTRDLDPNGTNCTDCDDRYHIGLNVNGSVTSLQTNIDRRVPRLPNPFDNQLHFTISYTPDGRVQVRLQDKNEGFDSLVIDEFIAPLNGDLMLGFTGGTGSVTMTAEIDDFVVSDICCDDPESIELDAPENLVEREAGVITASAGSIAAGAFPNYNFEVVEGPGQLFSKEGSPPNTIELLATAPGEIVLRATVNDGVCADEAVTEVVITVDGIPCPDEGDTFCTGVSVTQLDGFDEVGIPFQIVADAFDKSGDIVLYEYLLTSEEHGEVRVGPTTDSRVVVSLLPGPWIAEIFVDDSTICDDTSDDANCRTQFDVIAPCNPLGYGESVGLSLAEGTPACFQLPSPADSDRTVIVNLVDKKPGHRNIVYANWGSPASPFDYDYIGTADSGSQRLRFPSRAKEPLYLLLQAARGDVNDVSLQVDLGRDTLSRCVPDCASNAGRQTISIHGIGLTPLHSYTLVHDETGDQIPADASRLVSSTRAEATFNLARARTGLYHLSSSLPNRVAASLRDAFVVKSTDDGPNLEVSAQLLRNYRAQRTRYFTVSLRNTGDRDLENVDLLVSGPAGTNTQMRTLGNPGYVSPLALEASDPDARPGVLPAGGRTVEKLVIFRARTPGMGLFQIRRRDTNELLLSAPVTIIASRDPNSKDGPLGGGDAGDLIDKDQQVNYTIQFANIPPDDNPLLAAPVQKLEISDVLDQDLDIETFQLAPVVIGDGDPFDLGPLLPCLDDSECFRASKDVTVTNALGTFNVRVEATVDNFSNSIRWSMAAQGLTSSQDALGFLTVDDPEDEAEDEQSAGSVSFVVEPEEPKEPETDITNEATITFDDDTVNSLTTSPPTHHRIVLPPGSPTNPTPPDQLDPAVPADVDGTPLQLSWSDPIGADTFDVYLSRDGEPLDLVARNINSTSFTPPLLDPDQVYQWRVDAVNEGGTTESALWRFRTEVVERFHFVRGDVDADGAINITDPVFLLNFLFLGGQEPPCLDAADADDDGGLRPNITDAIIILSWLFQGGSAPAEPTPSATTYIPNQDCGPAAVPSDGMVCRLFGACP
ncbi:MAG: hypothetical protein AAF488_10420, partial [Planctomycetota bacterium]